MTVQEILHWKQELRRVRQEFLQVWKKCPRCGAKWADIAWDAESDHEWLIVECKNRHLFRANEEFWLFDYDRKNPEVYAPSEEVDAYAAQECDRSAQRSARCVAASSEKRT